MNASAERRNERTGDMRINGIRASEERFREREGEGRRGTAFGVNELRYFYEGPSRSLFAWYQGWGMGHVNKSREGEKRVELMPSRRKNKIKKNPLGSKGASIHSGIC